MSLPMNVRHGWLQHLAIQLHHQRLHSASIMETALDIMNEVVSAQFAYLVVFGANYEIESAYSLGDKYGVFTRGRWGQLLLQRLTQRIQERYTPVVFNNLQTEPELGQLMHNLHIPQPYSALALPLMCEDVLLGAVVFVHAEPEGFDDALIADLAEAASFTACALANAREHQRTIEIMSRQIEQERLRRDLSAMIYHDLRGPLHNIAGSLSRLERFMQRDSSTASSLIRIAATSTQQMMRMIKSLLDIERLESNSFVDLKPVTIKHLLQEAVDMVNTLAYESEQAILLELDEQDLVVEADRDMLLRVMINLLENAVKHTPRGGRIVVSTQRLEDDIQVRVTDTGPGIPLHLQQEIFDKYVRLKSSFVRDGYGLGLAFCRLAVEAHGGHIWVESDMNGGAVFAFSLPAAREAVIA